MKNAFSERNKILYIKFVIIYSNSFALLFASYMLSNMDKYFLHQKIIKYLKDFLLIFLLSNLLIGCQNNTILNLTSTPTVTEEFLFIPKETNIASAYLISPCDLIEQQYFNDVFQDATLFTSFKEGTCSISNQWDTKTIQFHVSQGTQADQAIRWYTKKVVKARGQPTIFDQINVMLTENIGKNLSEFQEVSNSIYQSLNYREEMVFSVGEKSYWYTYSLAQDNILESSEQSKYVRITTNGFLSEEALEISVGLAKILYEEIPGKFSVNFNFNDQDFFDISTPGTTYQGKVPIIGAITVDKKDIFFGDLCGNEVTNIQVEIVESENINSIFFVYRLISPGETTVSWISRNMNKNTSGTWEIQLSAESDFSRYQLVNGAQVEYAISVLYGVNGLIRSPEYTDIRVYQCRIND